MAWEKVALPLSMVVIQLITVGSALLSKLALNGGTSPFIIIVYRNLIAAVVVAPLAVIYERQMWQQINLAVWGWIFAKAIFGDALAMGLYFYGLQETNASYSAGFQNLIPIATFIIAVALRVEKMALGTWLGKMKLIGALLCVGGTMVLSLSKGRLLHPWRTNLLNYSDAQEAESPAGSHHNLVTGTLFLCGSSLSYAIFFIVQEKLVTVFPSRYLMPMLTSILGSMQAFVVAIFLSHDREEWVLKRDLKLLTVVYSGVFHTGLAFVLLSWVIRRRGPVYPTIFNPFSLILTTIIDSVLLGTNIYLGSVLGALLIVVGLYANLWGKDQELKVAAAAAQSAATATAAAQSATAATQSAAAAAAAAETAPAAAQSAAAAAAAAETATAAAAIAQSAAAAAQSAAAAAQSAAAAAAAAQSAAAAAAQSAAAAAAAAQSAAQSAADGETAQSEGAAADAAQDGETAQSKDKVRQDLEETTQSEGAAAQDGVTTQSEGEARKDHEGSRDEDTNN